MKKNVLIIHYNTPELTEAAIKSLNKNTKGLSVIVFDNSDVFPYTPNADNVSVIDNTKGQVIDFNAFLDTQSRKVDNPSSWGSMKHCMSVDKCFDLLPGGFLLMDSDVLIKQDVSPLFDESRAWVGSIHTNTKRYGCQILRIVPFLCYINVPMLKMFGIRYFNEKKMWFLNDRIPDMFYDTGAWLLEDCNNKGLGGKIVNINEYAIHLRHGSWKTKEWKNWLEDNKMLWIY